MPNKKRKSNEPESATPKALAPANGWADSPDETSTWWWLQTDEPGLSVAKVEWRDSIWGPDKKREGWVTWMREKGGMSSGTVDRMEGCRWYPISPPIGRAERAEGRHNEKSRRQRFAPARGSRR